MDEDLHEDLTDIRNIGDATVEKIEAVLDEHDQDQDEAEASDRSVVTLECESCGFVEPEQESAGEDLTCPDCGGLISWYAERQFEATDHDDRDRDSDVDLEAAGEALRSAWDYHEAGQHSYAARFVEEAAIALETDLDP